MRTLAFVEDHVLPEVAAAPQLDLFHTLRPPVTAAWGAGRNSTAMLIEWIEGKQPLDAVLFANAGAEKPETYTFIELFRAWLCDRGVTSHIVRYEPKNFKDWPPYYTLEENCLIHGVLPSIAFGFGSCSIKWKVTPQNRWTESWEPARAIWAAGGKVIKLIGYDCSPRDCRRYAEHEGYLDDRYIYRYPLREWGWTLEDCIKRIQAAGLPVPPKSSCDFCTAVKPHEVSTYTKRRLHRLVLMEARAHPRLKSCEGLWRRSVAGVRGGTPRPGSMTAFIRDTGLLEQEEISAIVNGASPALASWLEVSAALPPPRNPIREWLRRFDDCLLDPAQIPTASELYNRLR
jgi:hypothetical protein